MYYDHAKIQNIFLRSRFFEVNKLIHIAFEVPWVDSDEIFSGFIRIHAFNHYFQTDFSLSKKIMQNNK